MEKFIKQYRKDLNESEIPFWLNNSIDKEFGGYFTCLDRDGSVFDTKKYMWLEAREVWMFSRLYNEYSKEQRFLDAAKVGFDFIYKYGRDDKGRVYFALTREGKPYSFQRKPYGAVFYVMALLEYGKATNNPSLLKEADTLFWNIVEWIKKPGMMDRSSFAGQQKASALADLMVVVSMALELENVYKNKKYTNLISENCERVKSHFNKDKRILIENAFENKSEIDNWPETRFVNPGHSIEVGWFLIVVAKLLKNKELIKFALGVISGSLEFGWDKEYGGLYYFMDIEGRPTLQLESTMKLWWPHTEAIYALILAYKETGDNSWLEWLEKVHQYAYKHFADPKYGSWFGYCDRYGKLTNTCKGGNYKGFFHVPRALLFSIQEYPGK
jgi:N-acylglucosamine 2-epimerase